jgi:hypothetical protein
MNLHFNLNLHLFFFLTLPFCDESLSNAVMTGWMNDLDQ